MVRDSEGQWSLPQFVTLTGGSVGWQAGIQGTDVILVFMTRKSVEGLRAASSPSGPTPPLSAGPVGRNASAATDARLKAEILSYWREAAGCSSASGIDGSAIETNAKTACLLQRDLPMQSSAASIPESATRLRQDLDQMSPAPVVRARLRKCRASAGPRPRWPPAAAPAVNHLPTLRRHSTNTPRSCMESSMSSGGLSWACRATCSTSTSHPTATRCKPRCVSSTASPAIPNTKVSPTAPSSNRRTS